MRRFRLLILLILAVQPVLAQQSLSGDITGDGILDRNDLVRGLDIALGRSSPPTAAELSTGDFDRNGTITTRDLVLIARTLAGVNRPPIADAGASSHTGNAGAVIQLDANRSLDLDGDVLAFTWSQIKMGRSDRQYVSENDVVLSDESAAAPTFVSAWPGRYRFLLRVADPSGLVSTDTADVIVDKPDLRQLDTKGIIFGDVFGELGGPTFDLLPDSPTQRNAVLESAMDGVVRSGGEWIGIVPAAWYSQINPLPRIGASDNSVSLTDETDYAAIIAAAKSKGLKVVHREQLAAGLLPLRPGEQDSLAILQSTSAAWWDAWFTEWKNYLLPRAEWAERYGVDMFDIFHFGEETFRPDVFPQYGDRWRDIISSVRAVYSGKIAINLINTDKLNFADALDVVHVTVFPGLYTTRGVFPDVANPSIADIRQISEDMFNSHEADLAGTGADVYYIFLANSSDAQIEDEPPPDPSFLDNREQTLYYEGFFQALADETWVTGFFSERWAWFEALDRPGVFFDQMLSTSPRNKPAEEQIKIWFGAY